MSLELLYDISPSVNLVKVLNVSSYLEQSATTYNVFIYVATGQGYIEKSGLEFPLAEGDITIIGSMSEYSIKATPGKSLELYICHFETPLQQQNYWCSQPVVSIPISDQFQIKNRFSIMYKEYIEKKCGYKLMLKSIAIELITIYIRNQGQICDENKMSKSQVSVKKVLDFINTHFADATLDNNRIAWETGLTSKYLSQIFKQQVGTTIHRYLNNTRIEKAKELLLDDTMTITEVSALVGFSSIHSFSKVFKRIVGMPPSEFIVLRSNDK